MDDTHLITLLSGFCFDFTHMFAPGGLKDEELDALFPQLQAAEEGLSYIRREGRAYHHLSKMEFLRQFILLVFPISPKTIPTRRSSWRSWKLLARKYPKGLMWCSSVA